MRVILSAVVFCFCLPSFAFFSLMDTGNLVKEGDYRILGEGQLLFDAPEGFNLNSRFSTGMGDDAEIQFEAGVGSVDFYLGAFYKWIPFPDTEEQPALGLRGGVTFADYNGYSTYGFNVTPLISKNFDTNIGYFAPYSGLILGLQKNTFESFFSMQLAIGLQWRPNEWDFQSLKDFNFLLEYAVEVDDSFNHLSLGAAYNF